MYHSYVWIELEREAMNRDEQERTVRNFSDTASEPEQAPRRRRTQAARLRGDNSEPKQPQSVYARPQPGRGYGDEEDEGAYASSSRNIPPMSRKPRSWDVGGEDERPAPQPRKQQPAQRDPYEDEEYDDYEDEAYEPYDEDEENGRGGSGWWVWLLIVVLVAALLAGVTFFFARHSDIAIPRVIEPVVSAVRSAMATPTPAPTPTPEPTPVPTPTPAPVPEASEARVIGFTADPAVVDSLDKPVTLQVVTSTQTDFVQIVDNNGQELMLLNDGYSDSPEGRVWRMMYYFASPYEDIIEAYPGNVSGWNESGAARIYVKATEPQPEPTVTPEPTAEPAPQAAGGIGQVDVTESIYVGGQQQESFSRENAVNLGDASTYMRQGNDRYMAGVLTYRSSGMRQNAAYGNVETAGGMTEVWSAETGAQIAADEGWGVQPLISKWNQNIRQSMPLDQSAMAKSALKEVVYASGDGKIYFFDLDTGAKTRDAIEVRLRKSDESTIALSGAASIYSNGLPLLAVGGKDVENGGMYVYNLVSSRLRCIIDGSDTTATSTDRGFLGAAVIDADADTIIAAGNNGGLYTLTLNKEVKTKDSNGVTVIDDISITTPSMALYRAAAGDSDATVETVMAACGEYAYYATKGGMLCCVNLNTMQSRWAIGESGRYGASLALDDYNGVRLYAGTRDAAVNALQCIDAETGDVVWTKEFEAGFVSAPVIGTDSLNEMVIVTVSGESGATVYALSKADGSEVWSYALNAPTLSSPIALYGAVDETTGEAAGAWIVAGSDSGELVLLNGNDGTEVTRLTLSSGVSGSPAAFNGMLVVATQDGQLHGVEVK